jgi:hypothetical protein
MHECQETLNVYSGKWEIFKQFLIFFKVRCSIAWAFAQVFKNRPLWTVVLEVGLGSNPGLQWTSLVYHSRLARMESVF